jgi:prepilin peptidase CpaA
MKDATVDSLPSLLAALAGNPGIALVMLVIAAAVIDVQSLRIPNWLTVGGMVLGLAWNTAVASAPLSGVMWALGGLAVGLVVLLPFYAVRVMGAGDVKLMAAVGAFLGFPGILYAILFTFIAGGILALMFALAHRSAGRMAANVGQIARYVAFGAMTGVRSAVPLTAGPSIGKMPYGISIAIGTTAYVVAQQLGYA